MKAIILAAGYGTRIKHNAIKLNRAICDNVEDIGSRLDSKIFDVLDRDRVHHNHHKQLEGMTLREVIDILDSVLTYPKTLLKIGSETVIDSIMEKIRTIEEIDKVYVITNAEQNHFFRNWSKGYDPDYLKIINNGKEDIVEQKRREAVGDTVFAINTLLENDELDDCLVIAGDSYMKDVDFSDFIGFYHRHKKPSMLYYTVDDKERLTRYGCVKVEDEKVKLFIEKPTLNLIDKFGNLKATQLFYIIPKDHVKDILEYFKLEDNGVRNMIERLQNVWDIRATEMKGRRHDIGALSSYIDLVNKI